MVNVVYLIIILIMLSFINILLYFQITQFKIVYIPPILVAILIDFIFVKDLVNK